MLIGIDGNEANIKERVGSNQYAFEVITALSNLATDHEFVIYLKDNLISNLPKESSNWHYRVLKPKKFWTQWRLPLDLYINTRKRPDIFFTPGHYAPRFSPVPVIVSIMDLGFLKFPKQFTKKDLYQLKSWTKTSVEKARHVLAISESTKNDIIREYQVPENKITVTYPGFDKDKFNPMASKEKAKSVIETVKKKYGISKKYILFLSTLKPSKNIIGLLEAFKILTNKGFGIDLVIAGKKGWMYEEIFEKTKKLELLDRVVFTDFVPNEDVAMLMSGAEIFVLPSFWEGFGIPILEAMACGTPVVVSDVGSLPEVVGDAGILVNPNEPNNIAQGITQAMSESKKLKEKGLEQVKKFSWVKCAQETIKVLETQKNV